MPKGGARVREAERWLQQAELDTEAAKLSAKGGRHEWACFQSQQAGEKALKAVLFFLGRSGVSSHSLLDLLQAALQERPELTPLRAACKGLDDHYIATRYPDAHPAATIPGARYSTEDSSTCVTWSESILTASRSIIRGSGGSPRS